MTTDYDGYDSELEDDDLDDELEDDEEGLDDEDDELDEDDEDDDELDDEEVVLSVLDRVERAEDLSRGEIEDLGWVLGDQRAGAALGRALNDEARQARLARRAQDRRPDRRPDRRRRRRTFGQWFAGPIHQSPDVLPDSVAAVLLRIRSGQPLSSADAKRLGAVIGRRTVATVEALIHDVAGRHGRRRSRAGGR